MIMRRSGQNSNLVPSLLASCCSNHRWALASSHTNTPSLEYCPVNKAGFVLGIVLSMVVFYTVIYGTVMLIDLVGKLEEEAAEQKKDSHSVSPSMKAIKPELPAELKLESPPRATGDAAGTDEEIRKERMIEPPTVASSEEGDIWEGEASGKDYEIVTYHRRRQ